MQQSQPTATLSTIGYEGCTSETYFEKLMNAGITVLCDVRRNPISRKPGFSRSALARGCEEHGIRYVHLPALGIASDKRKTVRTQEDYDALFAEYETNCLPNQQEDIGKIQGLIDAGERVALSCFERKASQCHRHCVSDVLRRANNKLLRVSNL